MNREWTDKRIDDFADRADRFEANIDRRFGKVDQRFDRFEGDVNRRFDKVDKWFDKADAVENERFAGVHAELATVSSKMDKMNRRVMSGLITLVGAVIIKVFLG